MRFMLDMALGAVTATALPRCLLQETFHIEAEDACQRFKSAELHRLGTEFDVAHRVGVKAGAGSDFISRPTALLAQGTEKPAYGLCVHHPS